MRNYKVLQNITVLAAALSAAIWAGSALALPEGESIAEGTATFDRSEPNVLKITTPSDKVIINYNSFSIAAGESVYFYQPSATSAALNRVLGSDISNIFGTLTANGIIYLINPNGINIGSTARINTAGIFASTLNIANTDFMAGNLIFSKWVDKVGKPVINNGYIKIAEGGQAVLMGSAVANAGTIETSLGSVVLAAGEKITLNLDTAGMISVVIDEAVKDEVFGFDGEKLDSAVRNSGTILNPGGKVILAVKALNHIFDHAINNSGVIQANSLVNHNGVIELVAEGAPIINTGKLEAGRVSIKTDADLINRGEIIANKWDNLVDSGSIYLKAVNLIQDGLVAAVGGEVVIEAESVKTTLAADPSADIAALAVVIRANEVNISARNLGASALPVVIDAGHIRFHRTSGNIDILESLGIGTSVLLRAPPDGFGALLYNKGASLTLDASAVQVLSNITYFYGNISFYNFRAIVADQEIYFEVGKTYHFLGNTVIKGAVDAGPEEFFIKLRSSQAGAHWYLSMEAGNYLLERVNISDAYALNTIVIPIGVDAGHNVNFEIDPTWDGGGATNNWSDAVNWSGNTLPTSTTDATFNATSTKDSVIDAGFAGAIRDLLINAGYTGTITFQRSLSVRDFDQAAGTVDLGSQTLTVSRNFAVSGGTFNAGTGSINITNNFAISGTGIFNAGSANLDIANNFTISGTGAFNEGTSSVTFSGAGATINVLTTETFYNLTFNATAAKTVSNGDTLIVTGTLTLTDGSINTGTVAARGNIVQASTFDGGTGDLLIDGASDQTFTGSATVAAGELPDVTINKSGGTLFFAGTIRTNGQGAAAWTYTAGTINAGTSTIVFDGGMTITGSHTLNNVTFNNAGTRVIASGTTLTITGTFNYNDGTINTGTIAAQGNIIQGSATDGGSAILQITGSANQLFTGNATTSAGELPDLTINKSGGTLTLAGTIRINGAGAGAWTYIAGIVDATTNNSLVVFNGGNTIDGQGTSATMAFDNVEFTGGTATLAGNFDVDGNLTISGGTLNTSASDFSVNVAGNWSNAATFNSNNSVVTLDGSANSTLDTGGVAAGDDFQFLVINKSGGAVVTLINNNLDINGTLTISSGVLYLNGFNITTTTSFVNNGTLRLQGIETVSWTVNDTDSGTWEYVGRNIAETIIIKDFGATDYFNLIINDTNTNKATFSSASSKAIMGSFTVSAGNQIVFAAGTTQTISGALTLNGASGNLIVLRSSVSGSQWSINAQGSVSVSFIDLKDSNNTNGNVISAANSKDSGNNTNWNLVDHFTVSGSGSQAAGTAQQLTITAIDGVGGVSTSYSGDKVLIFSGANSVGSFIPTVTDKNGTAVTFGSNTIITFTNGVSSAGGSMVLYKAGATSVSASQGSIGTGTALSVTVGPGNIDHFTVSASAANLVSGDVAAFVVTAYDVFGSIKTDYTGTVHISSTDTLAFLPADHTFTSADNGSHTFNLVLRAVGLQTVTATDTAVSSASGSQSVIVAASPAASIIAATGIISFTSPDYPDLQRLEVVRFTPFLAMGQVYFYRPLVGTELAGFGDFILEEGAYEFIDGNIKIRGHAGLLPLLK